MRNKTRKFSRAQRILLSWYRETPAVMRAQTFSVCAKPQGARPARTNCFSFLHNVGFDIIIMHNKIMMRIYINWTRVRTRPKTSYVYIMYLIYVTLEQ